MLHDETRADFATRALLASYLAKIEANEPGVQAGLDPECLHDLRVACRRTRSVLGELEGVLDPIATARARSGLAWLGTKTGPLRDLDVFLEHLRADPESALGPLVAHAEVRRTAALAVLRQALASEQWRAVIEEWHAYLRREPEPLDGDAARPMSAVARERIAARLERIAKRRRDLADDATPRSLHRLRIQVKKLRYLVDAFGELLAPDASEEVARRLAKLQDTLGEFHDGEVEIELLEQFADDITGVAPAATLLAMGRRQAELARRMTRLRRRAERRLKRFVRKAPLRALVGEAAP